MLRIKSSLGLRLLVIFVAGVLFVTGQGCAFLTFKIKGIPAESLPEALRYPSKLNLVSIDISKLAQPEPDAYRLDKGDVLGIIVDGVLPYRDPAAPPQPAPVHYPEGRSDLPPAIGVPVLVQESGEITLPAIGRVRVAGLTLEETTTKIRTLYEEADLVRDKKIPPVVTIHHPRSYNVMVIREDTSSSSLSTNLQSATGGLIRLPAYKNDVLNALVASGGLPGLNAKNEIRIRRKAAPKASPFQFTAWSAPPPIVKEASQLQNFQSIDGAETIIPMRIQGGMEFEIRPEDIILNEGDIVYIANRDSEVFYSGGLLPGGQHQIPRDRDIDVFEAMAISGYSYARALPPGGPGGGGGGGGGGGSLSGLAGIVPSQLFILRKRPDGTQYAIDVDLEVAVTNECERLLIAPGDKLLLRYKPSEEVFNFGILAFFTYGVAQFFRN